MPAAAIGYRTSGNSLHHRRSSSSGITSKACGCNRSAFSKTLIPIFTIAASPLHRDCRTARGCVLKRTCRNSRCPYADASDLEMASRRLLQTSRTVAASFSPSKQSRATICSLYARLESMLPVTLRRRKSSHPISTSSSGVLLSRPKESLMMRISIAMSTPSSRSEILNNNSLNSEPPRKPASGSEIAVCHYRSNARGDDEKTQLGWNFEFRRVTAEG